MNTFRAILLPPSSDSASLSFALFLHLSVLENAHTQTHKRTNNEKAFSSSEMNASKSRLNQLQAFQATADNAWKAMRWIMDVINFARDKQDNGITLESLQRSLVLSPDEQLDEPDSPGLVVPTICLPTPQHLELPHPVYHGQRRTSRDDSAIGLMSASALQARMSNSTSTHYLFEPVAPVAVKATPSSLLCLEPTSDMRRCVSTSRLNCEPGDEKKAASSAISSLLNTPEGTCDSLSCQISKSRSFDQSDLNNHLKKLAISSEILPCSDFVVLPPPQRSQRQEMGLDSESQ